MVSQEVRQFPGDRPRFFYGYIVVAFAFLIMMASIGTHNSFGVFLKPVLTEFDWTRAVTSGAFSLSFIVSGLLGVVMGGLTDRFGPRLVLTFCGVLLGLGYLLMSQIGVLWQLYLFFGIIGFGMAGTWVPLVSTTARWFVKRRALMTGFVVAGMGVGTLIAPQVANYLISIYDWRVSYIVLGGVVFLVVVLAAQFLRRDPAQKGLVPYSQSESKEYTLPSGTKSLSFTEAVHTRQFWLFAVVLLCYGFSKFAIIIHIVLHITELGISTATAASILATTGGVSLLGNAVLGGIGDRIGNRQAFAIGFVLMSVALFWLIPAVEVWQLYLFAGVFGFAYGGLNTVESPLAAELFGLKSHGLIYGTAALGFTIGASLGPLVVGYMFDVTSSYRTAFWVSAAVSAVALIFTLLLRPTKIAKSTQVEQ